MRVRFPPLYRYHDVCICALCRIRFLGWFRIFQAELEMVVRTWNQRPQPDYEDSELYPGTLDLLRTCYTDGAHASVDEACNTLLNALKAQFGYVPRDVTPQFRCRRPRRCSGLVIEGRQGYTMTNPISAVSNPFPSSHGTPGSMYFTISPEKWNKPGIAITQ